jgi:methyl-accepting chemotaxis protein
MFKNLRIGSRLSIGFILIFLILTALTHFGINRMELLSDQTTKMYKHPLSVSNAVLRIDTNIIKMHRSMKNVALAQDSAGIEESARIVDELEQDVFKDFEIIDKRFLGEKEEYEKALAVFTAWKPIRDEVIDLMNAGQTRKATDITSGKGALHVVKMEKAIEALDDFAQKKASEFLYTAENTKDKALNTMYLLSSLAIILGSIFAVFLTRSITRPIKKLSAMTDMIGMGRLDTKIDIESGDEVGQLAGSFNSMADDLKNITTSRDDLDREINEHKKTEDALSRSKAEFEAMFNSMPDSVIFVDTERRIIMTNPAVQMTFGYNWQNDFRL